MVMSAGMYSLAAGAAGLSSQLMYNALAVVSREHGMLMDLHTALAQMGAEERDLSQVSRALKHLHEMFQVVVVGEFSSGKSTLLNALLGGEWLQSGVTPTTASICRVTHGQGQTTTDADGVDVIELPVPWLRNLSVVDTPGTNAIMRQHELLTSQYIPNADIVMFVTSADRAFTESERTFLSVIREWQRKVIVVVNKFDLLRSDNDRKALMEFVTENARECVGQDLPVFPVSAFDALACKLDGTAGSSPAWEASRFETVEEYLHSTLVGSTQLRLKLETALGVSSRLVTQYSAALKDKSVGLDDDVRTISFVHEQLAVHEADIMAEIGHQLARVDAVLYSMENRMLDWLDNHIALANFASLMSVDKLRKQFEDTIGNDLSTQVETIVGDAVDWLIHRNTREFEGLMDTLQLKAKAHQRASPQFQQYARQRAALLLEANNASAAVLSSFQVQQQAARVANSARASALQTAAAGAGAVGIGGLVALASVDVTGLFGAGTVAAAGLFILPHRRAALKSEASRQAADVRQQLHTALTSHLEAELGRAVADFKAAMVHLESFVEREAKVLSTHSAALAAVAETEAAIRRDIDAAVGGVTPR